MDRALREFRIRGVTTNLTFVEGLINHPKFRAADYTTQFIDETPELFKLSHRRDRATRLLRFIADVSINGNNEVAGRPKPTTDRTPLVPSHLSPSPPTAPSSCWTAWALRNSAPGCWNRTGCW